MKAWLCSEPTRPAAPGLPALSTYQGILGSRELPGKLSHESLTWPQLASPLSRYELLPRARQGFRSGCEKSWQE